MNLNDRAHELNKILFLGFQPRDFERGGREQFIYLLESGLNPHSKVVDIGCGVLRAGFWLLHFLNSNCYFGIEPHKGRLDKGKEFFLSPELLELKQPRFDYNASFNTSVFGEKFDFFLAYSIWTHASKMQISLTLDSFSRDASDHAVFLTTYLPAGNDKPDYLGNQWMGTSHESEIPGCIHHSLQWIFQACEERGLELVEMGKDKTYGQSWLKITRKS